VERKRDGTAVTQADKEVEAMAARQGDGERVAAGCAGEEMGGESAKAPAQNGRARMIIDPIDGTEESLAVFHVWDPDGIEENGEIVAGMASAPELGRGTRWWGIAARALIETAIAFMFPRWRGLRTRWCSRRARGLAKTWRCAR